MKRPLPDSEAYEERKRRRRRRKLGRALLFASIAAALALVGYLALGGELSDAPARVRALLRGGRGS